MSKFEQGGDAQAISRIANSYYGGFKKMFDAYGWDVPGNKLMISAPRLIVEQYGSVEKFVEAHAAAAYVPADDIWDQGYSVYWSSFWDWTPETWGTVGFTQKGRRDTIIRETTDPFIFVIYITKNAGVEDTSLRQRVAGFYLVSHEEGHRDAFTDKAYHGENADQWQHSLKAIRAFSYLPEYRPNPYELDPTLLDRALSVAKSGERLSDPVIEALKQAPYVEVPVFGGNPFSETRIIVPQQAARNRVSGGTVNRSGYIVDGEPINTEKELYVLKLDGDVSAFLDGGLGGFAIYKIGLSMSPATRRASFNKSLPGDALEWKIHRTTRLDGHAAYPTFEAALAGEEAMKDVLGAHGEWMGGEFYAATPALVEQAWRAGREAAFAYMNEIAAVD